MGSTVGSVMTALEEKEKEENEVNRTSDSPEVHSGLGRPVSQRMWKGENHGPLWRRREGSRRSQRRTRRAGSRS